MNGIIGHLLLLPRNLAIAILLGYRATISKTYGDVCRYYPSCSRYALDAVAQFGLLAGCGMAIWRIVRCNPWSRGGVDDVPAPRREWTSRTRRGFVVPASAT